LGWSKRSNFAGSNAQTEGRLDLDGDRREPGVDPGLEIGGRLARVGVEDFDELVEGPGRDRELFRRADLPGGNTLGHPRGAPQAGVHQGGAVIDSHPVVGVRDGDVVDDLERVPVPVAEAGVPVGHVRRPS
jgi:hypothetical protein